MKKLLNFMKNTKLKNAILLIFLLFLYVFISAQSYVTAVSENLSDAVFRLHVLANSDSDADQTLKIKASNLDIIMTLQHTLCVTYVTHKYLVQIEPDRI